MTVIGRHIDKIHTVLHSRIDGLDALFLADAMEHMFLTAIRVPI